MGKIKKEIISEELLAAYLDGIRHLNHADNKCIGRRWMPSGDTCYIRTGRQYDWNNFSEYPILPISQMAAKTRDNLCDFQCETYILKKGVVFDEADCLTDAKQNSTVKRNTII